MLEGIQVSLETKKSVILSGSSIINGEQVIYLSANVTTNASGDTSISQSIQNQTLYRANLKECRKDIDNFQTEVWKIEDGLISEAE